MTNTNFSVESKSQLAKLLATENITIQHQKIATAAFNPATRTLYCPIWEKMDGPLYDLLMGHEVGHAHDTPADGWHSAVSKRGGNYKSFLNVVEDARIEKRIKRRYPGLRKSFVLGYNDLLDRNFFGIKDKDVNELPFIDRLNLFTKSDYTLDVDFNDAEKVLLEKVKAMETWQDALDVTELVWEYSKEEQSQMETNPHYEFTKDDDGDYDFDDANADDQDGETGQADSQSSGKLDPDADDGEQAKKKTKGDDEDSDSETKDGEADTESEDEDESDDAKSNAVNRFKQSSNYDKDFDPVCATDNEFRKNETSLVSKSSRNFNYIKLPTPNLKNIVTPASVLHNNLTNEFIKQNTNFANTANELYSEFKRKNERYISMLAKEFEMRKAADKFSKVKTSTSGDIDISKLYKFQTDDNIFRKMAKIPKGKSHGLVLLLDKSGSMNQNMASSIEQILILSLFCRKVNIPFVVYGFGNASVVRKLDFPESDYRDLCFSHNTDELVFDNVFLREYLNSKMGNAEFQKAVKNLVCLMSAFSTARHFLRPHSESLSNTPLTQSLVALQPLIKEFRQSNRLDIVNLSIIHDGDADQVSSVHRENGELHPRWLGSYDNNILIDAKNKVQIEIDLDGEDGMRIAVAKWLAKTTGVKIFGFFLVPGGRQGKNALYRRLHNTEIDTLRKDSQNGINRREAFQQYKSKIAEAARTLRKEKFLESKNAGYEAFYMLPDGNDLSVDDDEIVVTGKVTTSSLTKAFMKYSKDRQVNRVLVSKFIQGIAV